MPRTSAKTTKGKREAKKGQIPLDRYLEKPRKGRPVKIRPSWVRGRADNYRYIFNLIWRKVWPGLAKAETREDVLSSFSEVEIGAYAFEFVNLADLILEAVRDPKFPKRKPDAQVNFLADSIGAHGMLTPRSSRDVCERERARIKHIHRILCYEFYIECSCGYKGHSRNHGCPICEAKVDIQGNSASGLDAIVKSLPRT